MTHRRRAAVIGLIGASLLLLAATAGSALAANRGVQIVEKSERYSFAPKSMTVALGDTVTWTNTSDVAHTVTADDGSFASPDVPEHGTYHQTFSTAGTIAYHCTIHTYMTGTIVVLAAGQTLPPTDTAPVVASGGSDQAPLGTLIAGLVGAASLMAVERRRRLVRRPARIHPR